MFIELWFVPHYLVVNILFICTFVNFRQKKKKSNFSYSKTILNTRIQHTGDRTLYFSQEFKKENKKATKPTKCDSIACVNKKEENKITRIFLIFKSNYKCF